MVSTQANLRPLRDCAGPKQSKEFMTIMSSSSKGMLLRHPMMSLKHKMASFSVDYAKREQEKRASEKGPCQEEKCWERQKDEGKKK